MNAFTDSRGRAWVVVPVLGGVAAVCLDKPVRAEPMRWERGAASSVATATDTWMGVVPNPRPRRFVRVGGRYRLESPYRKYVVATCGGRPYVDRCWTSWRGMVFRGGQRRIHPFRPYDSK